MTNWLFQTNLDRFDAFGEMRGLRPGSLGAWSVSRHLHDVRAGDNVALWISGEGAGVYALARATGEPSRRRTPNSRLWKRAEDRGKLRWFAPIKWLDIFPDVPLTKAELRADRRFRGALILRQPFGGNPFRLTEEEWSVVVDARRRITGNGGNGTEPVPPPDPDEEAFPEGRVTARRHLLRERSRKLRSRKIADVRRRTKRLACEVCAFEFGVTYGAVGEGYIEVHHLRPLSDAGVIVSRLSDVAVICSNCHRMAHRRRPWATLRSLRDLLKR